MAVEQFQTFLHKHNLEYEVIVSKEPTRTAVEAAEVHDVPVSSIVKSMLLYIDGSFVLFLVPGDRRLDLDLIKKERNAKEVRLATPDEVKLVTGYSIGGVPPFGHTTKIPTVITQGFDQEAIVVPAAGAGNAVFKIPFAELQKLVA